MSRWAWGVIIFVVLSTAGVGAYAVNRYRYDKNVLPDKTDTPKEREKQAVLAGKSLTAGRCKDEGVTKKLSHSPMDKEDFGFVIPYGLMVGGHVTPIDHQYFSPADYNSEVNAYEVYAMADSTVAQIEERPNSYKAATEYRMIFSVSCTFLYYYDLVTGLEPGIKVGVDVKAGQLIGRIGGRTLDYAVWDTTKPLDGFVVPEHYKSEAWKIYTADPLNYYTDELKAFILSRYVRTVEPISGKIDHDIDGKLVGNWFLEGTEGYAGSVPNGGLGYWSSHLAIAPDLYDPTKFIVSIGALYKQVSNEADMQYMITESSPLPTEVSVETGVVKYTLKKWNYYTANGASWDQLKHVTGGVTAKTSDGAPTFGCVAVQLAEARKLTFELFRNKTCADVNGFTSSASTYYR